MLRNAQNYGSDKLFLSTNYLPGKYIDQILSKEYLLEMTVLERPLYTYKQVTSNVIFRPVLKLFFFYLTSKKAVFWYFFFVLLDGNPLVIAFSLPLPPFFFSFLIFLIPYRVGLTLTLLLSYPLF